MSLGDHVARRLTEAAAAFVDPPEAPVDCDVCSLLQFGVERRLHAQPSLIERVGAVLLLQLLADVFGEIGCERPIRDDGCPTITSGLAAASRARASVMKPFFDHARQDTSCCAAPASDRGSQTGSVARASG